jgi:DNA mismatch repair protein MutS
VVAQATGNSKCFAVFDELFRGTNIEDAVEISTTTIKGLRACKNSIFFISTHLHQLKQLEEVNSDKIDSLYIDCELKDDTPLFNYQLKKGWSDLKVGRILFEREGLNNMLAPSVE